MQENPQNQKKKREPQVFTDYAIFRGKVRLILDDGNQTVIDRDAAIDMAKAQGKNLVQVGYSKDANPRSTCKIMDYGKYRYDLKKREKENQKRARDSRQETKEVQFSIRIDDGDKARNVARTREFLSEGMKVKIVFRLFRREIPMAKMAMDMLADIVKSLSDVSEPEGEASVADRIVSQTIRPRRCK